MEWTGARMHLPNMAFVVREPRWEEAGEGFAESSDRCHKDICYSKFTWALPQQVKTRILGRGIYHYPLKL